MENYLVHDSRRGKVFATPEEAQAYQDYYFRKTRQIVCISRTSRKVTHTFKV